MRVDTKITKYLRLIYITDWFSTFLKLAGVDTKTLPPSDSKNVWRGLTRNKKSRGRRKEIVLNLDRDPQEGLWSAAIRSGDLKLIWGQNKLLKQKVGQFVHSYSFLPVISGSSDQNSFCIICITHWVSDAGGRRQCRAV